LSIQGIHSLTLRADFPPSPYLLVPTTLKLGLAGGFAPKLRSIVLSADTGGADLSNPTE